MKQLNRRGFLKNTGLLSAAGVLGLSGLPTRVLADQCKAQAANAALGIQTYMVRAALKTDVVGTLETLAEAGFRELELFGIGGEHYFGKDPFFGLSLTQFADLVQRLELAVPSAHVAGELKDPGQAREMADALGIEYFIEAMAPELISYEGGMPHFVDPTSLDAVRAIATRLNRRGEQITSLGRTFAYHNHNPEFVSIDGQVCMDVLVAETDPELVKLELDLGWIAVAGFDPVERLQKYAGRVIACHMKDFDPSIPLPTPTAELPIPLQKRLLPPGAGTVDFATITRQLDADGIRHRFIEVDAPADPLAEAKSGLCHLAGLSA